MSTRKIVGVEALARIATPQMGFASPAAYVELAERNQRIDALTYVMTRAVAKHVVEFDGLPCSINVSPMSLERVEFADLMEAAVCESGSTASSSRWKSPRAGRSSLACMRSRR